MAKKNETAQLESIDKDSFKLICLCGITHVVKFDKDGTFEIQSEVPEDDEPINIADRILRGRKK